MSKIEITIKADGNITASKIMKEFTVWLEEVHLGLREGNSLDFTITGATGVIKVKKED